MGDDEVANAEQQQQQQQQVVETVEVVETTEETTTETVEETTETVEVTETIETTETVTEAGGEEGATETVVEEKRTEEKTTEENTHTTATTTSATTTTNVEETTDESSGTRTVVETTEAKESAETTETKESVVTTEEVTTEVVALPADGAAAIEGAEGDQAALGSGEDAGESDGAAAAAAAVTEGDAPADEAAGGEGAPEAPQGEGEGEAPPPAAAAAEEGDASGAAADGGAAPEGDGSPTEPAAEEGDAPAAAAAAAQGEEEAAAGADEEAPPAADEGAGPPQEAEGGAAPPPAEGEDGQEAPPAAAAAEEEDPGSAVVTFIVKPENIKYTRDVKVTAKCAELKTELYDELRILPEALTLKLGQAVWEPDMPLSQLGVQPGGDVEMELVINLANSKKERAPLTPGKLPGQLEVQVDMGPGQGMQLLQVDIDQSAIQEKLYLGGFRNKKTGALYHHACTQTPRKPKYSEADRKLSRETQTYQVKTLKIQTTREQCTQMRRPGVLLDESNDYILIPGPYMTADELLRLKEQKTVVLQCAARAFLARRRANELRQQKIERERFLMEQEDARNTEEAEKRRYEIQRRMHPRTAADFEILYNELEAWRLQETSKVKAAGMEEELMQEALKQILAKETKLLQTIDRLKTTANQENKSTRVAKTLHDMSAPKKWDLSNGRTVQVHTPFTTRAKELAQLYNGLNLPLLTTDERLDVLLHIKWTVKEFDCNLTREVVELVDREADLLNRGRSPKTMEGLRKRIASLFLAFIETPEFNPEAGRFQIVPLDFDGYQQSPLDGQAPRSFGTVTG